MTNDKTKEIVPAGTLSNHSMEDSSSPPASDLLDQEYPSSAGIIIDGPS